MRHALLTLTVVLSAILAGCGGSGTNTTPDPDPNPQTGSFSASIPLTDGTVATLTVEFEGTDATGELTIPGEESRQAEAPPVGTFPLEGQVDGEGRYSLQGPIPDAGEVIIVGQIPGQDSYGSYEMDLLQEKLIGGILNSGSPKPAVAVDPPTAAFDPGGGVNLSAIPARFPSGDIEYRWFIAAPAAYFHEQGNAQNQGQDLWLDTPDVRLQTAFADRGKLQARVHAYHVKDGVKTFLAAGACEIQLTDIELLETTWVSEVWENPKGGTYTSYGWQFPVRAGAKRYLIEYPHPQTGQIWKRYLMLPNDIDATEETQTPIYYGWLPHSYPPVIPVTEQISGTVRDRFHRRFGVVRTMIAAIDEDDPDNNAQWRAETPIIVRVYY